MVKKSCLLVALFAFIFLANGCITVYTDGCCPNKPSGPGLNKNNKMEKFSGMVKDADDWVRENIW